MIDTENIFDSLSKEQKEKFDAFAKLLKQENAKYNLTSIDDIKQIRTRHFCDSLAAVAAIEKLFKDTSDVSLIDIGSGAGFPALAIAIALPCIDVTSIEATGKKVAFQQQIINEIAIDNVKAVQARAEDIAGDKNYREMYNLATARAVAPLNILAELTLPFVKPGGYLLAWKGAKSADEIEQAKTAIEILGGKITEQMPYQIETERSNLSIICIKKIKATPKEYPRKYSTIKKQPLGSRADKLR